MRGIDATRLDLAEEFRAGPFGHHSPDLQALLNDMRAEPIEGKYFLYMTRPHREWALARMSTERPLRAHVFDRYRFERLEDAEWAVFCLRWEERWGQRLAGAPIQERLR